MVCFAYDCMEDEEIRKIPKDPFLSMNEIELFKIFEAMKRGDLFRFIRHRNLALVLNDTFVCHKHLHEMIDLASIERKSHIQTKRTYGPTKQTENRFKSSLSEESLHKRLSRRDKVVLPFNYNICKMIDPFRTLDSSDDSDSSAHTSDSSMIYGSLAQLYDEYE